MLLWTGSSTCSHDLNVIIIAHISDCIFVYDKLAEARTSELSEEYDYTEVDFGVTDLNLA